MHLTLSPTSPANTWYGVFFPRRGPYSGAIIRFTLNFAPPGAPEIDLQTRVFHPLVDSVSGRVHLSGDGEVISELLEEMKTIFESEDAIDALAEAQAVDKEAWKSWNGRRNATGGWNERVAVFVNASKEDVKTGRGDKEVILLKGDLGDVEKEEIDRLKSEIGERLKERGVRVREN
ncbi:hypothetical protein K440DRAFT_657064 [Wilcoxina mikolae CBS 423.85]|nr:hypothetical protein K440DRAFT_657064 [Wilcoxina mikolae CBS 423.85]